MRGAILLGPAALIFVFMLSGCVARTYQVTRERVDQDMSTGNHGYLMGTPKQAETSAARKTTRDIRVVEIELGMPYKGKKSAALAASSEGSPVVTETEPVAAPTEPTAAVEPSTTTMRQYTVAKGDTLQKISQKFYGTTKKWHKIYKANKDVLKGPDKVYPGQVINIPQDGAAAPAETVPVSGVKEGLK